MKRFVFVAFLQFGLCVPPTFVTVGIGGITTYPAGCDTVRALQCTVDSSRSEFLRLTIYDTDNPNKRLVSMKMRSGDDESDTCQTGTQPASCVLNGDETLTLTVVLTDLRQGETRRYGCEANYYDVVADKEISYTNVSVPNETRTSLTTTHPTSATSSYQTSRRHFSPSKDLEESTSTSVSTTDEKSPGKTTTSVNVLGTQGNTHVEDSTKDKTFLVVVNIAIGAGVSFAFTLCVVVIWMCRRRCGRLKTPNLRRLISDESDRGQRPGIYPPEMVISYQPAAEEYNDLAMLNETPLCARAERPLPKRPTSAESDYQELPGQTDSVDATASDAQCEGPYADVKDDVLLLEKAGEKMTEEHVNDTELPGGGHLETMTEEQKTALHASESGAENDDYVPIRDVVERKRRAEEDKAKRATVV